MRGLDTLSILDYLILERRRTQVVKGVVCKTTIRRFDSARRLPFFLPEWRNW